jgi:GNAT superfamily N-acetyltransferase
MTGPDGTIRPFDPDGSDYAALARILAATDPDAVLDEEWVRVHDRDWDYARFEKHRWVAVEPDGTVVGSIDARHHPRQHEPWRYLVLPFVHPDAQRRGWGSALLAHAEAAVRIRGARELRTEAREDVPAGIAFAQRHGFEIAARSWQGRLNLETFDPGRFGDPHALAAARAVKLVTLADELARNPRCLERVWQLVREVEADIPRVNPVTELDYEAWRLQMIDRPGLIREAYFLAVRDGEYVGVSFLRRQSGLPAVINQALTGVARASRGQGIAFALKIATAAFAKADGARELRTWNSDRNPAILHLNDRIGFVRKAAGLDLVKRLRGTGHATAADLPGSPVTSASTQGVDEG